MAVAGLPSFAIDVARTAVWFFLLAVIFVPLERLFPQARQAVFRRQFGADIGWYVLNSILTAGVLAGLSGVLAVGAQRLMPASFLAVAAELPVWQRILATLVVGEFGFYWGHRWSHEVPLLWRFHAIHHSAAQVDWLTASRGHPVDLIFTRFCGFTLISAAGLAQPTMTGATTGVMALMVFSIFWGFFIHANLRWRLGWLESVIATPAFHRWHHTNDGDRDHNYASTLPIYDRLFGTWHLPKRGVPPVFGTDTAVPDGLLGQLLGPLGRSRR